MGYSTRPGTSIKDFWPDDSPTELYLESNFGYTLTELQEAIEQKWPNAKPDEIRITSEKIHTYYTTHDLYDGSDYTEFLVVKYNPSK